MEQKALSDRSKGISMQSRVPSRSIMSAASCLVIVVLSFTGALDSLPYWLRGLLQSADSIAGVFAGWALQEPNSDIRERGAVRAASAGLIALAQSINNGIGLVARQRGTISNGDYRQFSSPNDGRRGSCRRGSSSFSAPVPGKIWLGSLESGRPRGCGRTARPAARRTPIVT